MSAVRVLLQAADRAAGMVVRSGTGFGDLLEARGADLEPGSRIDLPLIIASMRISHEAIYSGSLMFRGPGALIGGNLSRACALGVPYVFPSRKAPGKRQERSHPGGHDFPSGPGRG